MATLPVTVVDGTSFPDALATLQNQFASLNLREQKTVTVSGLTAVTYTYTGAPTPQTGVAAAIATLVANPTGLTSQQVATQLAALQSINFSV